MNEIELKHSIESSIKAFLSGSISQNALNLFAKLGYKTDRQNPFIEKTYRFFKESFLESDTSFNEAKARVDDWKSIDLLFQLTQEDLSDKQTLFDTKRVDNTIIETYLFFAIELIKTDYSRSTLAQITRELNKIFPMPVMLLFKYGETLTLSIINRRLHKKDEQKDVLEKVTLIKDISTQNPHRAHIEILFDLSFDELKRLHKFTNFVELHNAWQKTLDTKELNKRFYRELSNWYFWAINYVSFPNDIDNDKDDTVFNSESIIRLLTRLIFIWFIKEKNLIPDKIFEEKEVSKLIKGFKTKGSTVYYRAILQNLFFATLNQKIEERAFATDGTFEQNKKNYGIKNLYRYSSDFAISKDEVIKLFKDVPFLNGGLFDCLDSDNKNGKVIYLDGFSRNPKKQAQVPDELFFSQEKIIDLSDVYDDKKKKNEKVKGLFEIFNHYKFTITENTPIEEEVALDPELLGRVFENLLASYNPETKTTARKQTGSFYTPREIVNYMVDESLKAYLKQKLETEAGMKPEDAEVGLEFLLGYNEKEHLFDEEQTSVLVNAIDNCKILDPACGSGAFPMGILHKLVYILHKLDPQNKLWEERQLEKVDNLIKEAGNINDSAIRDKVIADLEANKKDIEESFSNNELDYGRKLYLIENCIYGIDIQPIATQISKLRFFISLIVDQKADKTKVNFGIRPLPNLETKFVAANTLIGIDKPKAQGSLFDNQKVKELEEKLKDVRHRLFSAKTSANKRKLREEDQKLREEICNLLEKLMNQEMQEQIDNSREKKEIEYYTGLIQKNGEKSEYLSEIIKREEKLNKFKNEFQSKNHETAHQLAVWDPYNQNASSPFFDPEWMFGITEGFDVVIGNPPYVDYREISTETVNHIKQYKLNAGSVKPNLYLYFIERGFDLLRYKGVLSFINPNQFLVVNSAFGLRKILLMQTKILFLVDVSYIKVFDASTYPIVWAFVKEKIVANESYTIRVNRCMDLDLISQTSFMIDKLSLMKDKLLIPTNESSSLIARIEKLHPRLKSLCKMAWGTSLTGYGKLKIHKDDYLKLDKKTQEEYMPILQTRDIKRYLIDWQEEYIPTSIYSDRIISQFRKPKILIARVTKKIQVSFDDESRFVGKSTLMIDYKQDKNYLLALLNSKLLNFYYSIKYESTHMAGGYLRFDIPYLEQIPIPNLPYTSQIPIIKIVDYVFISKKYNLLKSSTTLETLIDAIAYELYFPSEIKTTNAEVLKYLANLPELKADWSNEKKLETIEKFCKVITDMKHPVSIAMGKQKTVPEVRIIEGLPALMSEVEEDK